MFYVILFDVPCFYGTFIWQIQLRLEWIKLTYVKNPVYANIFSFMYSIQWSIMTIYYSGMNDIGSVGCIYLLYTLCFSRADFSWNFKSILYNKQL